VRGEHQRDVPLDAQYKCSVYFPNPDRLVPLGMTGRFVVASPPRSIFSRFVDKVFRTFSIESMV
jgi:hypothetical protein